MLLEIAQGKQCKELLNNAKLRIGVLDSIVSVQKEQALLLSQNVDNLNLQLLIRKNQVEAVEAKVAIAEKKYEKEKRRRIGWEIGTIVTFVALIGVTIFKP